MLAYYLPLGVVEDIIDRIVSLLAYDPQTYCMPLCVGSFLGGMILINLFPGKWMVDGS